MACRWLHRRFDNTVTFHIIFQGQYLPAGFCWDTVAQYYVDMAKKKAITDPVSYTHLTLPTKQVV